MSMMFTQRLVPGVLKRRLKKLAGVRSIRRSLHGLRKRGFERKTIIEVGIHCGACSFMECSLDGALRRMDPMFVRKSLSLIALASWK